MQYLYIQMHKFAHVCVYVCVCIVCIRMCVYTYVCMYSGRVRLRVWLYIQTYVYTHVCLVGGFGCCRQQQFSKALYVCHLSFYIHAIYLSILYICHTSIYICAMPGDRTSFMDVTAVLLMCCYCVAKVLLRCC